MSTFAKKLNILGIQKPLLGLKLLQPKRLYNIIKASRCQTKYGPRILVELDTQKVFLPIRFNDLEDGELNALKDYALVLIREVGASCEIEFKHDEDLTPVTQPTSAAEVARPAEERFEVIGDFSTRVRRFNVRGRTIEFKIKAIPDDVEPTSWIKSAITDILKCTIKDLNCTDKVGITFCGKSFEERGPAWINFKNVSDVKSEDVWEMISKIFQSNSNGLSTDTFCMSVTSVRLPHGSGNKKKNRFPAFNEECSKRRGIITIKNADKLCLPRALVVAIAHANNDPEYQKIRPNCSKMQTLRAVELINEARVNIPSEGCGIPELRVFQNYLNDYNIVVYEYGTKGRNVIFIGFCNDDNKKTLNLLYYKEHYNVIISLTAAFACSYYCEKCHIPYNNKNDHKCGGSCPQCQQSPRCPQHVPDILCGDCNRCFRGQKCFDSHKAPGVVGKISLCKKIKRCNECLKTYDADRKHICGEYYCKICSAYVPQDHLCYIPVDRRNPNLVNVLYIFYDLESRQEKVIGQKTIDEEVIGPIKQHEPNLCVFQQRCDQCLNEKNLYFCQVCKFRSNIITQAVIPRFLEHILKVRTEFRKVVVLAHNGQAYDHQFILNYILRNTHLSPELILRGTKIILMKLDNVRFLDSLNYFPMALSKLPKAFDLPQSFKKGYFPHLFNTKENENYIGLMPRAEYYSPNTMRTEERDEFFKWYKEHEHDEFNTKRDLIDYCISDVQILTGACLTFRKMFLDQCNVEPFLEAVTIASACNLVYRRGFLHESTIGLIPKKGYRYVDNQSEEAIKWMIWEEDKRKINIIHAAKGREKVIAGVKVDGFCEETKQIFEFHGCYYHGHPVCLQFKRDEPLHEEPNDTLNRRYDRTIAKTKRLESLGYEVIEMWACEFERQITNKDVEYLNMHSLVQHTPLNPREAFYGGRTGNTYNYFKCKEGEQIKYIDICSLYPWVCKYGKFPLGHPKVHTDNISCSKLDLKITNGLIKCKILPPEQLLHPVLPIKQNNKLMFSLCRTCSDRKSQEEFCSHSTDERALTGTWVIDEVAKAVEKGYKLLHIFEIWEYSMIQYDKVTKSDGLFTNMMNKFLKIKQEASGWPGICVTEKEKDKYIADFFCNEDIKLEFADICNNPGKRSFAKLILNSFWGKFGQRENQRKTSILQNPSELYQLFTDPAIEVCHILPINEENIVVNWEYKKEAADSLSTVNVCIAAYTTTQARLKLYSYLEKLNDRVLYYDTDSVIYLSREGQFEPPVGEFIGDMTDELECYGHGSYITEFVSGGPKNYAYKVHSTKLNTEEIVCKVKGIYLNYSASQKVNFDTIKEAVLNAENHEDIKIFSQNIRRTREHEIVTVEEVKTYKPKAEKRRFLDDHSSLPYGYKRKKIAM